MDNNERSNQDDNKSKIKIKKKYDNSPREFKTEDKKESIPLHTECKTRDINEIIPLPNESKIEDKKEIIPQSLEDKTKDKNEIISLPNECVPIDKKDEDDILHNQNEPNNNNNINIPLIQPSSKENNINTFPKGTDYEEQLNQYFQYFNVLWYDPNNTNEYKLFEKCFEKVEFYRVSDFFKVLYFFKGQRISEWIVVTPGYKGEELIMNLENFKCIKYFFVYCENTEPHENWTKKYKKIICLTSDPEILCLKFLEVNDYFIPNFNYKCKENIDLENPNENYESSKFKIFVQKENIELEKYNKLCIKMLKYLDRDDIINDLKKSTTENTSIINLFINNLAGIGGEAIYQMIISIIKYPILLSLYFNKYPYLLNLLTYQEVEEIFKDSQTDDNSYEDLVYSLEELGQKISNNESILDEKEELKEVQINIIRFTLGYLKFFNSNFLNLYQIINFFRDIDFCLKVYIPVGIIFINNKKLNFIDELSVCLSDKEIRNSTFIYYTNSFLSATKFTDEETNIINDTLTIKDFIIIGDNKFHEKIKIIESIVKSKTFKYLNIEEITNYLEERQKVTNTIRAYFYFLVIKYEEFEKNIEKIYLLSLKTGITFLVFLYIENENNIKIKKRLFNYNISIIIVYSINDIIDYLSQKLNFSNPLGGKYTEELGEILNIKIPKITFEQNEEDKYQDGCFELADTFDINLIRNKFVLSYGYNVDFITDFRKDIYYIYKEHNALDIFFKQNCIYFDWYLYPEYLYFNLSFVKRFLYMYCREERPPEKSFYRIINDDLRTRDPRKIYRYINILAFINQAILEEELISFKGKVYRATKLDENLILKLIPGTKMVNTTFWSTSKKFEIAEKFMINHHWRNAYIICKTVKNNIDLDLEKLNPYNEKEILFLPFTEFIVENITSEMKYNKKVYTIELTELEIKNYVNIRNMQLENANSIGTQKYLEDYLNAPNLKIDDIFKNDEKK